MFPADQYTVQLARDPLSVPRRPSNFSAKPGNEKIELTWIASDDPSITRYQMSQDQGEWTDIAGSGSSTSSHVVYGLTNGTRYSFVIRVLNAAGEGLATRSASAIPIAPPEKPTSLSAVPGYAKVTLSWDNPNNDSIKKYKVQQDGGEWQDITGSGTVSRIITGLGNGFRYSFAIRSENAVGESTASDTVPGTPAGSRINVADREVPRGKTVTMQALMEGAQCNSRDYQSYRVPPDGSTIAVGPDGVSEKAFMFYQAGFRTYYGDVTGTDGQD